MYFTPCHFYAIIFQKFCYIFPQLLFTSLFQPVFLKILYFQLQPFFFLLLVKLSEVHRHSPAFFQHRKHRGHHQDDQKKPHKKSNIALLPFRRHQVKKQGQENIKYSNAFHPAVDCILHGLSSYLPTDAIRITKVRMQRSSALMRMRRSREQPSPNVPRQPTILLSEMGWETAARNR